MGRWKQIIKILKENILRFAGKESDGTVRDEKPDGQYLCCIMAWEICEFARRLHAIPKKSHRLIIVDDGSEAAFLALEKAGHDINHMTLVTDREEHFERILSEIYEEDGLVVEVAGQRDEAAGMVLEFDGTFCLRLRDGTFYDRFFFCGNGREWEAGELQRILFGDSSEELFLFGRRELPDDYKGCIYVERLANS